MNAEELIIDYLSNNNELLKSEYKVAQHPLAGHCYVATETLYHVLGEKESDYTPCHVSHEGTTHWFLRHDGSGEIIDLTADQFNAIPPYKDGKGCGFQKSPSQRTRTVLSYLEGKNIPIKSPSW